MPVHWDYVESTDVACGIYVGICYSGKPLVLIYSIASCTY